MATTEERFASLESFRTETIKAYGEMAMELAMVKGLTSDAIGRLAVVQRDVSEIKAQISELDGRLNMRLDNITAQLALIIDRLPDH